MDLRGRKKIIIPINKEDFLANEKAAILEHISNAFRQHTQNVGEFEYLHNQYLGLQDILTDKKRYDESEINNTVVENHINKQVNFKVGFMYGNPIEYTIITEDKINTDDMTYLNKYFVDVSKSSLDLEKAQDLYEYGIAYQRLIPKRTKIEDVNNDAPFELVNMPVDKTFMVYSDDVPNEELFSVVVSSKKEKRSYRNILHIYMANKKFIYDSKDKKIEEKIQPYKYNPIIEFSLNKDRIGIVELVLSLQNLLNKIDSLQIDDIEESINSFMVFFNQKIDDDFEKTFKKLKKLRALILNTNNPQIPADLKILSNELKQDAVNMFYERVVKAMYDIAAVPQSSGNVTSGGDTGQARLLGNGWESAQNQAQIDQTYLTQYERKLLKCILLICKDTPNCPIKDIGSSDIAIKFNINMSNNLLVKAEAMQMLNNIKLPEKSILTIAGVTKDVDGLGDAWKKHKQNLEDREIELEQKKSNINKEQTNQTLNNNGSNSN